MSVFPGLLAPAARCICFNIWLAHLIAISFWWLAKVDTKSVVLRQYDNNKPTYGVFSFLHLLFYNEITICTTSDNGHSPYPFLRLLRDGYFRARSADAQFPPSELWKLSWHFSFSWLVAAGVVTENYKRRENELFQCFPWWTMMP